MTLPPLIYSNTTRLPGGWPRADLFPLSGAVSQAALPNHSGELSVVPQRVLDGCQRQVALSRMVENRAREYILGRCCADVLLSRLQAQQTFVGSNEDRSPIWPVGFVGSITHTPWLVAVAVAPTAAVTLLGVDAEPVLSSSALVDVVQQCLVESEISLAQNFTGLHFAEVVTLIFAAKEAFYKYAYPSVLCFFDFTDAAVVSIDQDSGKVCLRLLRRWSEVFHDGYQAVGRYRFGSGHVFATFESFSA